MKIDIRDLEEAVGAAAKLEKVRKAADKLSKALSKVSEAQDELFIALSGTIDKQEVKIKNVKDAIPDLTKNITATLMYKVMGSTPQTLEQIAEKIKKSKASVQASVCQYSCFSNVRGEGYICNKPAEAPAAKKKTTKKKQPRITK